MKKRIVLGITGASGSLYALELMKLLRVNDFDIHAVISNAGRKVMQLEIDTSPEDLSKYVKKWFDIDDFTAPMASGSSQYDGMAVVPCTMGTLAAIAGGISNNLLHRAADVTLKEGRPLVLAVRETPLSRVHLQNMIRAQEAGAIICPPMPALYHKPASLQDMAAIFAERLAGMLGLGLEKTYQWKGIDV